MNGVARQDGPFAVQMQAAYKHQLEANQASMSSFVNTIAAICEQSSEELNGSSVASALRSIDKASDMGMSCIPDMSMSCVPATPRESPRIQEPRPSPRAASLSATPCDDSTRHQYCVSRGITTFRGNEMMTPMSKTSHMSDKSGASENTEDASSGLHLIPAHVLEDSSIKMLPFILADGRIDPPIPILHRLLGGKYIAFVVGVKGLLSGWQPIGGPVGAMVHSSTFAFISTCAIIANFVFIVAQSDLQVSELGQEQQGHMVIIGHTFTGWYTFELLCNLAAEGSGFVFGSDFKWNLLDFVIVSVSWFEIIAQMLGGKSGKTSFLRIIRFMRISRVLRMFAAMRSFKEMKIMVDCLAGCLSIFFLCSVMLMIFLSLFAVFFVQGLATWLTENQDTADPVLIETLMEYFGSVGAAMLSLFICATGGDDWRVFFDVIKVIGPQYEYLFLLFIDFYLFAFVNVIVGVFCEKAASLAAPTTTELMENRYDKEFADARELFDLLDKHMENEALPGGERRTMGTITASKFEAFIADPEVGKYFEVRGLKPSSASRVFKMLCDLQSSDTVDYPTFVSAVVLLDGPSSCIDLHVISVRQLHGLHQMSSMMEAQRDEMREIHMVLGNQLRDIHVRMHDDFSGPSAVSALPLVNVSGNHEHKMYANTCSQLTSIEAEIKELTMTMMAAVTPMQSRVQSRATVNGSPVDMRLQQGEFISPDTGRMSLLESNFPERSEKDITPVKAYSGGADIVNRLPIHEGLSQALSQEKRVDGGYSTDGVDAAKQAALESKVRELEQSLEQAKAAKRQSSDALAEARQKHSQELEGSRLKNEQLQKLTKLQDAREQELQQQLRQLKSGYLSEQTNLSRNLNSLQSEKSDLSEQLRFKEREMTDLRSELSGLQIARSQPPPPPSGGFGWGNCASPRT